MFETVLVAVDRNDTDQASLAAAAALARHSGAAVRLLHVAPGSEHDEARSALEAMAAGLEVSVSIDVRAGDPAEAIIDATPQGGATVVCLTSQGRGALGDMLAGSVTEGVLAGTTAPVLVLGPACSPERLTAGGPVVICVDAGTGCEVIVAPAAAMITCLGANADVVEVVPPEERVRIDDVAPVDETTELGRARLGQVQTLLEDQGLERIETHVLYGADVAESVAHFAREHGAALVAMASQGRSGVRRLLRGSNSLRLIAMAPCPVLTIRSQDRN